MRGCPKERGADIDEVGEIRHRGDGRVHWSAFSAGQVWFTHADCYGGDCTTSQRTLHTFKGGHGVRLRGHARRRPDRPARAPLLPRTMRCAGDALHEGSTASATVLVSRR